MSIQGIGDKSPVNGLDNFFKSFSTGEGINVAKIKKALFNPDGTAARLGNPQSASIHGFGYAAEASSSSASTNI